MNPSASGSFIVQDREGTKYDSLQIDVRRRLSQGLLVSANSTYGIRKELSNQTIRMDRLQVDNASVFSMPQDIIDNTRRAYSSDPTTPTGYSALGVPSGRYIRPFSGDGCIAIYRGDCNAPDINLNGPMFTRADLRIKKQFPFLSPGNVELNFELLNAFNTINFNHALNPGERATIFQVTTAYTDINTTFDPGGRIGQIVWRINW